MTDENNPVAKLYDRLIAKINKARYTTVELAVKLGGITEDAVRKQKKAILNKEYLNTKTLEKWFKIFEQEATNDTQQTRS